MAGLIGQPPARGWARDFFDRLGRQKLPGKMANRTPGIARITGARSKATIGLAAGHPGAFRLTVSLQILERFPCLGTLLASKAFMAGYT